VRLPAAEHEQVNASMTSTKAMKAAHIQGSPIEIVLFIVMFNRLKTKLPLRLKTAEENTGSELVVELRIGRFGSAIP